jgi:plasmid rolling circle replication initiator protein Rep
LNKIKVETDFFDDKNLKEKKFIWDLLDQETQAKNQNIKVYEFIKNNPKIDITPKTLKTIHDCGNIVKWAIEPVQKQKKILYTESCKSRYCARCQSMKAVRDGLKIYTLANYLKKEKSRRFLFLTLTVPNVKGDELKKEIKAINKAFDVMMRRKQFEQFTGFIAKLEITYNRKRDDFHPHLHVLFSVEKDYFKKSNNEYLERDDLLEHWRSVMDNENITQVDIRALKDSNEKDLIKSIQEVAKYEAKSSDFTANSKVFETFYFALKGAKMLRYGREFRELGEVYELDEFGLFDDWRLKAEKFEDFTCKTISTWHFTRKEYDTLLADLTEQEQLVLKRKANLKSYAQFKTILKRLEREKSDAIQDANKVIGKLNRYIVFEEYSELNQKGIEVKKTKAIEKKIIRSKENQWDKKIKKASCKSTINQEKKIKKAKEKIKKIERLLYLYDIISRDFKECFKRKK